ncbi:MAG: hypothetical protein A2987_04480 [Omnitrophica bacterium RIFCSPLOWO2_01_FULL_45_10]|nr:MAG: hypothetical protein A2987_04480 [Omnitrophica bacterium RIFCSPLOWO2_01_FULL_45_10]
MQRIRYEVDPFNRLIIDKRAKKSGLPKFRKVIDGRFKIDGKNELDYHVKAPLEESEHIPHQFKIKGRWSLTDDHDLRLTIEKSGRETFGDEITLKGQILDVNENSLLFAVTTRQDKNKYSTYLLRLGGSWKADKFNRLSFYIEKEKGKYDILTFNGVWEIDKNH